MAILLFASLIHLASGAPAYAQVSVPAATAMSSPSSGPVGTTISVSGFDATAADGTPVSLGYDTNSDCSTMASVVSSSSNSTVKNGTFSGWFVWPTGLESNVSYRVCAKLGTTVVPASTFNVLSTSPPSVSVDKTSYQVGATISVTGQNFYPTNTSVTLTLESSNGGNAVTLSNSITSDLSGSIKLDVKAPQSPTGTVIIVATGGSGSPPPLKATSSQFDIHHKTKAKPTPTPNPTPTPTFIPVPPPVLVATPTPPPVPTATPTPPPTATPTAVPSPTVAPTPTRVPVATHANKSFFGNLLNGKFQIVLGIGLGMLASLGIMVAVGWLLLRRPRAPALPTPAPPTKLPPWMQPESLQKESMMTGAPFAETGILDDHYLAGYEELPVNAHTWSLERLPQASPFQAPSPNTPPGPLNTPQGQPAWSYPTESVPNDDRFGQGESYPQQVPFDDRFGQGNA